MGGVQSGCRLPDIITCQCRARLRLRGARATRGLVRLLIFGAHLCYVRTGARVPGATAAGRSRAGPGPVQFPWKAARRGGRYTRNRLFVGCGRVH